MLHHMLFVYLLLPCKVIKTFKKNPYLLVSLVYLLTLIYLLTLTIIKSSKHLKKYIFLLIYFNYITKYHKTVSLLIPSFIRTI